MVANVTNMLPKCAVVGKAKEHDSVKEGLLFDSLGPGDVGIADRAYDNFPVLYRQTLRGVYFVIHEKDQTRYRTISRADDGTEREAKIRVSFYTWLRAFPEKRYVRKMHEDIEYMRD